MKSFIIVMTGKRRLTKCLMQVLILTCVLQTVKSQNSMPVDSLLNQAKKQLTFAVNQNKDIHFFQSILFPRSFNPEEGIIKVKSSDWTSGFFSGCLWYMYQYSQDPFWKNEANWWTNQLEEEKHNTKTHDLGFMLNTSFGNGYRLTKDKKYRDVLLVAATSLASRFNSKVGCIRSWDDDRWKYPVIIDNMMNLELLFWAAKESGNKSFFNIAKTHALTTLQNHFRTNGSSYHVVDYDPTSGEVLSRVTAQGYSDESSWARGQAWGLYGFTMAFRETSDTVFLHHAEKIADYFINHLAKNHIPYWDFDSPAIPFDFQDASAAAIAASGLIELSQYSTKGQIIYLDAATEILKTLSSSTFLSNEKKNGGFLLQHSVGNRRKDTEVNAPLIYADYYYLEALIRYVSRKKKAEK